MGICPICRVLDLPEHVHTAYACPFCTLLPGATCRLPAVQPGLKHLGSPLEKRCQPSLHTKCSASQAAARLHAVPSGGQTHFMRQLWLSELTQAS